jgi:LemA protein
MTVNLSLLVWIGFALVLAWAVGAYSRLNRLRDQMVGSRNSLLKYAAMYKSLCNQGLGLTDESGDGGDPVAQLLPALRRAAEALQQPMAEWVRDAKSPHAAKEFGRALDAVQTSIDALAAAPDDLAGARWPQEDRNRWTELAADVRIRRSRYNVQVGELREAVAQMPASAMARLTGISAWVEV